MELIVFTVRRADPLMPLLGSVAVIVMAAPAAIPVASPGASGSLIVAAPLDEVQLTMPVMSWCVLSV